MILFPKFINMKYILLLNSIFHIHGDNFFISPLNNPKQKNNYFSNSNINLSQKIYIRLISLLPKMTKMLHLQKTN